MKGALRFTVAGVSSVSSAKDSNIVCSVYSVQRRARVYRVRIIRLIGTGLQVSSRLRDDRRDRARVLALSRQDGTRCRADSGDVGGGLGALDLDHRFEVAQTRDIRVARAQRKLDFVLADLGLQTVGNVLSEPVGSTFGVALGSAEDADHLCTGFVYHRQPARKAL